ncbi:MAG: DUF1549 domain-containing protein [Planctomycetota bacterium]|nr:DUF1549 domain-containing protein [Planctomycetota bacterium]MDA1178361.1 DUF1549 domain-containing protein [Planctomycetota bacterium]
MAFTWNFRSIPGSSQHFGFLKFHLASPLWSDRPLFAFLQWVILVTSGLSWGGADLAFGNDGASGKLTPHPVGQAIDRDAPGKYGLALQPVELPPGDSHPIDRLLARYYESHDINPPHVTADEQFARRVTLDLIGLPPTKAQLNEFLRDDSRDKRAKYIERLLADAESYTAHWITFWSDHFRIGSEVNAGAFDNDNTKAPQEWLLSMLRQSVPYDELARELIAGEIYDKYALCVAPTEDIISPVERAEMQIATTISQVFLGIQLKCAACHDSFIDRWTMQDAWGLAVALGGQELEVHRCQTATGQMALPQFPLASLGDIDPQLEIGPKRQRVAELMTCRANGLFARTIVNRLWARLIGRGLIEPLDEMMEHTPWNAELLDWLAAEFVRQGYDVKKLLLLITTSEAYQMQPVVRDKPLRTDEDYLFRGPELRSLTAEQVIDTIAVLGQMATPDANAVSTQTRAWQRTRTDLMTVLGRPTRDVVVSTRVQEASALMALEMLNGQELNGLVQKAATVQAAKAVDAPAFGEHICMMLLSRRPTENERIVLEQIGGKNFSDEVAADMIWTVAMLPEFLLLP